MENLSKKPIKGILKTSSSFEQPEVQTRVATQMSADKDIKWDEMNILQTLHPPDKDYGHMKVEEPKTPYSYYADNIDGEQHSDNECDALDSKVLANKMTLKPDVLPTVIADVDIDEEESDDEEYETLTEEEKKKRKEFEVKRKMHYNEFQAVKLARKLLEEEDEEEDEESNKRRDNNQNNSNKSEDTDDNAIAVSEDNTIDAIEDKNR